MIPEISIQILRVSADRKALDMSDILALIAYVKFSIGQILFRNLPFFANLLEIGYLYKKSRSLDLCFWQAVQMLQIINFLTVPKFIITPTVSQFQELFTFPFGPILENTIIG